MQMIAIRPTEAVQINMVDDHVEAYAGVIEALGVDGYEVKTFKFVNQVSDEQIDNCSLWVIDKRFGRSTNGLSLLKKLKKLRNKRVIMLTGFPATADHLGRVTYDERLNNLSVVIQKPRSFTLESGSLSELMDEVFSATEITGNLRLKDFRKESELEVYLSLSEEKQEEVFDSVLLANKVAIEKAWSAGAVWVCIFGVDGDVIETINDVRDIPQTSAIDAKCEQLGYPAFEIDRSLAFHNIGCSANEDHGGANIATYPHIKIEVPPHPAIGFHFDSGADTSLFCKNFIGSCDPEIVTYASKFRRKKKIPLQTQFHYVQEIEVTAAVKYILGQSTQDEEKELAKGVAISGLSVKNWQTSDLVASCSYDCTNSDVSAKCVFRNKGLIGRDFYVRNKLKILLSFDTSEAAIILDKE